MTTKVALCDECKWDGGWHYTDDGEASRCPNIAQAKLHAEALELTKQQNTRAFEAAKQIIRDFAERMFEVDGNKTREAMEAAQIPGPTVGRAYTACEAEGVIENTGRLIRNQDDNTRHRIFVWKSLRYGQAKEAS